MNENREIHLTLLSLQRLRLGALFSENTQSRNIALFAQLGSSRSLYLALFDFDFNLCCANSISIAILYVVLDRSPITQLSLRHQQKMETPEERMPGGRWLPVPGTSMSQTCMTYKEGRCADKSPDFKSAAYALAVGVAALVPGKKHLDWSDLTDEKMLYDILKPLCNSQTSAFLKKEGAKFDPERPMSMELPSLVIQTWNAKMPHKAKVHMSCDGQNIVIPSRGTDIYIRCTGHRWEAYGHFEDTATTTSPAKAASTLSNITHIEIKPATVSESPSVAAISVTASSILPKDVNDVVMMMSKLCNASSDILPATTNLQSQIEMLDASTKKFTAILRPCLLRTSYDCLRGD